MRKVKAAINMTLDGVFDHTAVTPDEAIHQHYANLLLEADEILYGRITYQLMGFWQQLIKIPSGQKDLDDFAAAMNSIPKIVFSRTLNSTDWESARIASRTLEEEVLALRQQPGREIFAGSRSIILQLLKLNLLDELQLCIHPVVAGSGMLLFDSMNQRTNLKLIRTKAFTSGALILYYEPVKADHTN